MFHLKAFPIIQHIIHRNVYNTVYKNILQCTLFSTDALNQSSAGTSTNASNRISVGTSTDALNETSAGTSTETSSKVVDVSVNTSTNASLSTESKPDKLYKKIEIEVRGHDPAVLESYGHFAVMAAEALEINVHRNVELRKPILERLTLLKSIHVHKKHRVQYETRTYYRYLDFFHLTGSTADTYLEYIERNLPEGVAMKVTMVELETLPATIQQAGHSQ